MTLIYCALLCYVFFRIFNLEIPYVRLAVIHCIIYRLAWLLMLKIYFLMHTIRIESETALIVYISPKWVFIGCKFRSLLAQIYEINSLFPPQGAFCVNVCYFGYHFYHFYHKDIAPHFAVQCTVHAREVMLEHGCLYIFAKGRGAFFVWRAPILSWPRIMCSQVRMLKFLEPSREMP